MQDPIRDLKNARQQAVKCLSWLAPCHGHTKLLTAQAKKAEAELCALLIVIADALEDEA
jgi:hypothetical protein